MWSDGLPNTIDGLLQTLRSKDMTFEQACELQRERFVLGAQAFGCVIRHIVEPWHQSAPYSGVGVAHKDIFEHDGYLPGLGRDHGHAQAGTRLARAPALLRAQGMHQLGTLAMAEDACSATAFTRRVPTPINPLDPSLAVGGSSSGSGVAVASGMVYASLGTDTAGSVRIPAMTCGVLGLKTTHALVDRQGLSLISPGLDSIGVLGRSVADIGHVLRLLATDLVKVPQQQLRVAYWNAFDDLQAGQQDVIEHVRRCFVAYGNAGSKMIRNHFDLASHHAQVMMSAEVGQSQKSRIDQGQACEEVRQLGMIGRALPDCFYHQSVVQRPWALQRFLDDVMVDTDVLMVPLQLQSLADVSEVYHGGKNFNVTASLAMHRMCGWINYLGLPALALPIGQDAKGHPVSIQLIARPRHELLLLALGQKIQFDVYGTDGIVPFAPQSKEISQ